MSQVKTIGQAISLTAIKSAVADVSRSRREQLTVHLEMTGAQTAFDAHVEGRYWTPEFEVTVDDGTDEHLLAFFAGELVEQAGGAAIAVGQRFIVSGAGDTSDNDLESAKGGVVVAGDIFQIIDVGEAAEALAYVANEGYATLVSFDEADTALIVRVPFAPFIRLRTSDTWTASEVLGLHIDY